MVVDTTVAPPLSAHRQALAPSMVPDLPEGFDGLLATTPDADPDRYSMTSPTELVPIGVCVVAVHGELDRTVPPIQSTHLRRTSDSRR